MDKIILLTDLETYKHYLEHVKKIREKLMIMRELGIKKLKKCLSSINP
jgi:DNA-directed RNA polymerase subunit N (RpoN/RPB10)